MRVSCLLLVGAALAVTALVSGVGAQYCVGDFPNGNPFANVMPSPVFNLTAPSGICSFYRPNGCCNATNEAMVQTLVSSGILDPYGGTGDCCYDNFVELLCGASCAPDNLRYIDQAIVSDPDNVQIYITAATAVELYNSCQFKPANISRGWPVVAAAMKDVAAAARPAAYISEVNSVLASATAAVGSATTISLNIGTNPNPTPLVSGGSLDLTARLDDTCPPPDTSGGWCVSGVLTMASPSPAPVMCPMYGTNACCTADMEDAYLGGIDLSPLDAFGSPGDACYDALMATFCGMTCAPNSLGSVAATNGETLIDDTTCAGIWYRCQNSTYAALDVSYKLLYDSGYVGVGDSATLFCDDVRTSLLDADTTGELNFDFSATANADLYDVPGITGGALDASVVMHSNNLPTPPAYPPNQCVGEFPNAEVPNVLPSARDDLISAASLCGMFSGGACCNASTVALLESTLAGEDLSSLGQPDTNDCCWGAIVGALCSASCMPGNARFYNASFLDDTSTIPLWVTQSSCDNLFENCKYKTLSDGTYVGSLALFGDPGGAMCTKISEAVSGLELSINIDVTNPYPLDIPGVEGLAMDSTSYYPAPCVTEPPTTTVDPEVGLISGAGATDDGEGVFGLGGGGVVLLLVIIVAAIALILGGIYGVYFLTANKDDKHSGGIEFQEGSGSD